MKLCHSPTNPGHTQPNIGTVAIVSRAGKSWWHSERYWNLPIEECQFPEKIRNAAYDDTIAALASREKRALYPERREALQDALFIAFSERLPMLPIVFAAERMVANSKLHGWEHNSVNEFGQDVDGWYFEGEGK